MLFQVFVIKIFAALINQRSILLVMTLIIFFAVHTVEAQFSASSITDWSYEEYCKCVESSGRNMKISTTQFNKIQERKKRALKEIEVYLKSKFGKADSLILRAFAIVPREYFQYNYEAKYSFSTSAYEIPAKPWGIGYGSALSDYLRQAYMTQLCHPDSDDIVLEIGTGSGFQAAVLSRIVKEVHTIEIVEPLAKAVAKIFAPLGYKNVKTYIGDGYYGLPEIKDGFDIIIVTCSVPYVPPPLLQQLKPGGRLIIPIGQPFKRGQVLYIYTKDENGKVYSKRDIGVFFIPMKGKVQEIKGKATVR